MTAEYPCLQHFASTTGFAEAALVEAFEVERVFHERILAEPDAAVRRAMYKDVYERVHSIYGGRARVEVFRGAANPKAPHVALFRPELAGRSVLDVGCGNGALLVEIARALPHGRLLGIDAVVPPDAGGMDIVFLAGDIIEFETPERYDVVFSDNVIEHVAPADLPSHLASIGNALRDGGTLIVLTPNRLFGPWDVTRILDDSYANAVPAGGTHLNEMNHAELLAVLREHGFERFRTVCPLARIGPRFATRRFAARWMVLAERTPLLVRLLRRIPNKHLRLPAFEMTVVCTKARRSRARHS